MLTADFSELKSNFVEILYSLTQPRKNHSLDSLQLFAPTKMHVFSEETSMGKAYKLFHLAKVKVLNVFSIPSPECSVKESLEFIMSVLFENAVLQAYQCRRLRMLHGIETIEKFYKTIDLSFSKREQSERYRSDLRNDLPDISNEDLEIYMQQYEKRKFLNDNELRIVNQTNRDFHEAVCSFWRFIISRKEGFEERAKINAPLLALLKENALLLNRSFYKSLKEEGKWVLFEAYTQQSIPIAQFVKLSNPKRLTEEDKKRLKEWVGAINSCETITISSLTTVLSEVIRLIKLQGSNELTFRDLLYWLYQEGCQLVQQDDPIQMEWRENLKHGKEIPCNGKKFIIGKEIGNEKTSKDAYRYFELEGFPNYIAEIANNRFRSLIKDSEVQSQHWGVRFVEIIQNIEEDPQLPPVSGLDKKGRCVILEKLPESLEEYVWTSNAYILSKADEERALIFTSHFYFMQGWNFYAHLSDKNLRRDVSGLLKATNPMKREEVDYNRWEWDCLLKSKGNIYVLSFLMNVSKLREYTVAIFYRNEVINTILRGQIGDRTNFLQDNFDKVSYYRHADALCKHALEIFHASVEQAQNVLKLHNDKSKVDELKEEVKKRLLFFYGAWPVPGFIPPYLMQLVVDSFKEVCPQRSSGKWNDYAQRLLDYRQPWPKTDFIQPYEVRKIVNAFNTSPPLNDKNEFVNINVEGQSYYLKKFDLMEKYNKKFSEEVK